MIRHGAVAEKHVHKDTPLGAPITHTEWQRAKELGEKLRDAGFRTHTIATSEKQRSIDTAYALGAKSISIFRELNEVELSKGEQHQLEVENIVPERAVEAGQQVLRFIEGLPPEIEFIIGHGSWMAGIAVITQDEKAVKRFQPVHLGIRRVGSKIHLAQRPDAGFNRRMGAEQI